MVSCPTRGSRQEQCGGLCESSGGSRWLPIGIDLGVDPIQFAAIIGVNLGMGNITPPSAPLLYLGARIGNTSVNSMLTPTLMMILFAWIPTLLPTTCIPDVALWLPGLVYGR